MRLYRMPPEAFIDLSGAASFDELRAISEMKCLGFGGATSVCRSGPKGGGDELSAVVTGPQIDGNEQGESEWRSGLG